MPVYEYLCKKCDTSFDLLVRSLEESNDVVCPACGGKKVEKLLSSFSCSTETGGSTGKSPSPPSAGCGGGRPFK